MESTVDIFLSTLLQFNELKRQGSLADFLQGKGDSLNLGVQAFMTIAIVIYFVSSSIVILLYSKHNKTEPFFKDRMAMLCPEINQKPGFKFKQL